MAEPDSLRACYAAFLREIRGTKEVFPTYVSWLNSDAERCRAFRQGWAARNAYNFDTRGVREAEQRALREAYLQDATVRRMLSSGASLEALVLQLVTERNKLLQKLNTRIPPSIIVLEKCNPLNQHEPTTIRHDRSPDTPRPPVDSRGHKPHPR